MQVTNKPTPSRVYPLSAFITPFAKTMKLKGGGRRATGSRSKRRGFEGEELSILFKHFADEKFNPSIRSHWENLIPSRGNESNKNIATTIRRLKAVYEKIFLPFNQNKTVIQCSDIGRKEQNQINLTQNVPKKAETVVEKYLSADCDSSLSETDLESIICNSSEIESDSIEVTNVCDQINMSQKRTKNIIHCSKNNEQLVDFDNDTSASFNKKLNFSLICNSTENVSCQENVVSKTLSDVTMSRENIASNSDDIHVCCDSSNEFHKNSAFAGHFVGSGETEPSCSYENSHSSSAFLKSDSQEEK